jgi:hypothetical protein
MSLASKLEAAKPVHKPKFDRVIEDMPEADRDALVAAAHDPAWSTAALLRVLKDEHVQVSKETLQAWRKRITS